MSVSCDKSQDLLVGANKYDLLTLVFDPLIKTLTLAITFEWYTLGFWYFKWVFLVTKPYHGYKTFDLVTLTLVFNLLIDNFNLDYIVWLVSTRTLIFHMSVSFDKTFLWVPTYLISWSWPWCLTYKLKTLTLHISFK
jgi:hypothetical protein